MIEPLQQKEAGIPTYRKAVLFAITEDCKRSVLYKLAKDSCSVPSDLQTTHAFLSLLLKLTFLCGYHRTKVLNFGAISATNRLSFCIFFLVIRWESWVCPSSLYHFLDRDMGTWATQVACTCFETICLGLPEICVCGCRDLYIQGTWPNASFFTWKWIFRWKNRSCLGKLGRAAIPDEG